MNEPVGVANLPSLANQINDEHKINMAKFDRAQLQRVSQIVSTVGKLDSAAAASFGSEAQQRMNSYLDDLLRGLKTSDVGQAGVITLDLARHIKGMNLPKMRREAEGTDWVANTMGRLPVVGPYVSAIRYFQLSHQQIIKFLNEIEDRARREVGKLAATDAKLDSLVEQTLLNIKEFEYHLAAGQSILMKARAEFVAKRNELAVNPDAVALMKLRDEAEQINAFEARLLRMNIAFTDALISIPQIRLTQEAARIEGRNIMDTLLFDLPRLKSAILRVAALKQISEASQANDARREITRQIGAIGAQALDDAYTKAKESQGSGAADVAMLAETADRLLETIAKGVRLDEENRIKRAEAERQLGDVKNKLLAGLKENVQQIGSSIR